MKQAPLLLISKVDLHQKMENVVVKLLSRLILWQIKQELNRMIKPIIGECSFKLISLSENMPVFGRKQQGVKSYQRKSIWRFVEQSKLI